MKVKRFLTRNITTALGTTLDPIAIPKNYLKRIDVRLKADITIATAAPDDTLFKFTNILRNIKILSKSGQSDKTIKNIDPCIDARLWRYYFNDLENSGTAAVAANIEYRSVLPIFFELPYHSFSKVMALPYNRVGGDNYIQIRLGTLANVFSSITNTTLNELELELYAYYQDDDEILEHTKGNQPFTFFQDYLTFSPTASGKYSITTLPVNRIYNRIGFIVINNGAYSNSIIDTVDLIENGNKAILSGLSFNQLRNTDVIEFDRAHTTLYDGFGTHNFDDELDGEGLYDTNDVASIQTDLEISATPTNMIASMFYHYFDVV